MSSGFPWRQTWRDLAFLHWPVSPSALRAWVPPALELDEFEGQAWLGIIPFWISAFGLNHGPAMGIHLPEINVRTYVSYRGSPGVWFFSLDTTSRAAVWGGRTIYHLPYRTADIEVLPEGDGVYYRSSRQDRTEFEATYRPTGEVSEAAAGSRDYWLAERYALYSEDTDGGLFRADIDHRPWPLQPAAAEVLQNGLLESSGLPGVEGPPVAHFARELVAAISLPYRVTSAPSTPALVGMAPSRAQIA